VKRQRRVLVAVIASTFFVGFGGTNGPLMALLAGVVMVAGVYTETGSVNPGTDWQPGD